LARRYARAMDHIQLIAAPSELEEWSLLGSNEGPIAAILPG